MQRTTAVAVGFLFALGIVIVLVVGPGRKRPPEPVSHSPAASAASGAPAPSPSGSSPVPSSSAEAAIPVDDSGHNGGFDTLPDGRKVPELPPNAPKSVGFGVVLVAYQGAQGAPDGARSKADAKKKAETLATDAKRDFAAAVAKGDRGSTSDAGNVPIGVLEPAAEYLLFTLPKGEVLSEPVDTPRGYWILRRNK